MYPEPLFSCFYLNIFADTHEYSFHEFSRKFPARSVSSPNRSGTLSVACTLHSIPHAAQTHKTSAALLLRFRSHFETCNTQTIYPASLSLRSSGLMRYERSALDLLYPSFQQNDQTKIGTVL